jgi:hypothetical protein
MQDVISPSLHLSAARHALHYIAFALAAQYSSSISTPHSLIMGHAASFEETRRRLAYLVAWSTGAGLLLSVAALPWPVWPALGASPAPEAFMPSMAGGVLALRSRP